MGFADRYLHSVNSSNLLDDEHHHATDALCAAAVADVAAAGFGALLSRVKFADGTQRKMFETGSANLASLMRVWTERVLAKGRERKWVREGNAWDAQAAQALYRRVAERSLAYWLADKCIACGGTGVKAKFLCAACKGTGKTEITGIGGFELERVKDMVSELENLLQSHNARASRMLRGTSHTHRS
jgi:DnaJ-class molecular chaperone